MQTGLCRLCERHRELRESHILPKFAFRWLQKSSVSPIRGGPNPNLRVQDGLKAYFLCADCEKAFAQWEAPFAANVFYALHGTPDAIPAVIQYGPWALKFAVSVSWRVLRYHSENPRFQTLLPNIRAAATDALSTWRAFLLGDRPHPGEFEQHLLPLGLVETPVAGLSGFFNRYIVRSVDEDLAGSNESLLVYSKLGKVVLFGIVPAPQKPRGWSNTMLHVRSGRIEPRGFVSLPSGIMEFISSKADEAFQLLGSMSSRQKQTVAAGFAAAGRRRPQAEVFEAFARDIELFGGEAVQPKPKKRDP